MVSIDAQRSTTWQQWDYVEAVAWEAHRLNEAGPGNSPSEKSSRKTFDLLAAYDKDLRVERLQAYKRLFKQMVNLPKYPGPIMFNSEGLLKLSLAFRDWYFDRGGLVTTESTRDAYFDLQDACKIILHRCEGRQVPTAHAELAIYLERRRNRKAPEENWNAPDEIMILAGPATQISPALSPAVIEWLRRLASTLRTGLTRDILSRMEPVAAAYRSNEREGPAGSPAGS